MYREFYSLLQNTGFGWNAETNTVTANEEVWRNYLQVWFNFLSMLLAYIYKFKLY
jgi:hypothetical protein